MIALIRILFFVLLAGSGLAQSTRPTINTVATASAFGAYAGTAAPGSYVEIYGANLAGTARTWAEADFAGINAPTALDGVTVTVNGIPAYVSYVSPAQVNVQIPSLATGGAVPVIVTYLDQASEPATLNIVATAPGLLAPASFKVGTMQFVAAVHAVGGGFISNGKVPGLAASLAVPGETITLYGTGFGPVNQTTVSGVIASGQTALANRLAITIDRTPATVTYAGLAPGLVGVYQINVVVPARLTAGDLAVQVTLADIAIEQTLFLPVSAQVGGFTLSSSAVTNGGTLPVAYTCDGAGSTLPLSWTGAPAGTKEFAVLMTTLAGEGITNWNWVLYNIPATTTSLARDSFLVGATGVGSDGPGTAYNPPCSQGSGAKIYTYTVYALSATPALPVPTQVTGQLLTNAIAAITLGSATFNVSHTRPFDVPGSTPACSTIIGSTRASRTGTATVTCDAAYAYLSSIGIPTHPMMNGILSTNLHVPIPQNFQGSNAWRIPLRPAVAATPTTVVDGPIGIAINGVPIFNPCTQGGCFGGVDAKSLGQLDICNGHAGRADDYHYHAAPTCLMADQAASYWDTHPLGWALDGFAILGYRDADGSIAARDGTCGGNTKTVPNAPAGYAYHVTDAVPYVMNCLAGTPSPDLAGQSAKYRPLRQPPVTPFNVTGLTLTTDGADGYRVLQFTAATNFNTTEDGTDRYANPPGVYQIRYKQVTGEALDALLATRPNASVCWNFQFATTAGTVTQPPIAYCR